MSAKSKRPSQKSEPSRSSKRILNRKKESSIQKSLPNSSSAISKSGDKKNCCTLRRTSGVSVVKRKNKNAHNAASEYSDCLLPDERVNDTRQKIRRRNTNRNTCISRKVENNTEGKERSSRKRLPMKNNSHHSNSCTLCSQPEPKPSRVRSTAKKKSTNLPHVVVELPCKKSVFEKACNLRRTIESGDLLPANLQPLLNDSVANKYDTNKLVATIREGKCKWQETEKRMIELEKSIRAELCIDKANPEKCLPLLDELNSLEMDTLMLKKNPRLVVTVQRLCHYVGNKNLEGCTEEEKKSFVESTASIRNKSEAVFLKFQTLFNTDGHQSFMRVFRDKVREYQETKNSKFLRELCQRVNRGFCRGKVSRQPRNGMSGNMK